MVPCLFANAFIATQVPSLWDTMLIGVWRSAAVRTIAALRQTHEALVVLLEQASANRVEDLRSRTAQSTSAVGVCRQRSRDVCERAGRAPRQSYAPLFAPSRDGDSEVICAQTVYRSIPLRLDISSEFHADCRMSPERESELAQVSSADHSLMDICITSTGEASFQTLAGHELTDEDRAASCMHRCIEALEDDTLWERPQDAMIQVRKLESLCGELASYAKGHPLAYESSFYSVEAPCCAEASVTPPPVVRASTTGSMSSTTCGLTTRTSSSLSIAAVS